MTYVCPRCGARSENPLDEAEGYCARCKDWTRIEGSSPFIARVANEAVGRHEARLHPPPIPTTPPADSFLPPGSIPPANQVLTPTADELRRVALLIDCLSSDGYCGATRLVIRPDSSWLEVGVTVDKRAETFAIWRHNLDVYRVAADGAVEDDPIELPSEFDRLVATAVGLLANYPSAVFTGESGDAGAVFVAKLREAIDALR